MLFISLWWEAHADGDNRNNEEISLLFIALELINLALEHIEGLVHLFLREIVEDACWFRLQKLFECFPCGIAFLNRLFVKFFIIHIVVRVDKNDGDHLCDDIMLVK